MSPRGGTTDSRKRLSRRSLLVIEFRGHINHDSDQQVTATTFTTKSEYLARRCPGRDPHLDRFTSQSRHREITAKYRFGKGHRNGQGQIFAGPTKQRMRANPNLHKQIARSASLATGTASTLQANALPSLDPGRDSYLDLTRSYFGS
jgi:hypothetical protein